MVPGGATEEHVPRIKRSLYLYEAANVPFRAGANTYNCFRQTRIAPLYEPAFAHAENTLRHAQEAGLDNERCHDDAANSDDVLDARLFVQRLRDALGALKAGKPEGGTLHAHGEALSKLFQQLFDEPTLKVKVKSSGVDGDPWVGLDIEGRCPTPYDVPALYIVGKDRLMSPSATEGAPEAKVPKGMLTYRNVVVESEVSQNTPSDPSHLTPVALWQYYPVYDSTCCPCLVIGTEGTTVQFFAAYLADRIYRTHICEFALDGSLPSDKDAVKLQAIQSTARMLRKSYAIVHTDIPLAYSARPHVLPSPSIAMPAPLPFHL